MITEPASRAAPGNEIEMGPEGYWQLWSDYSIHRIHMRVLDQIKRESE